MRSFTGISASVAAPAFAYAAGHAHVHPRDVAPFAIVSLKGTALRVRPWARASKGER